MILKIGDKINFIWVVALALTLGLCQIAFSADGIPSALDLATPADQQITDSLSRELSDLLHLDRVAVQVQLKSGVMTLAGTVNSLKTKEKVIELTEGLRGVTAVVDRLNLKHFSRSTDQVIRDAKRALGLYAATRPLNITISAAAKSPSSEDITLNGTVDSMAEKNLASFIVGGVKGVTGISNQILVVPKKRRSDAEIAADIKGEIRKDPFIDEKLISVLVKDSFAKITGTVPSLAQKNRLFKDSLVEGLRGADLSGIKIDPTLHYAELSDKLPRDDVQIQAATNKAFSIDPRLNGLSIHADVNDHVATLSGTVGDFQTDYVAEEDARNAYGITGVKNEILVRSRQSRSDRDINADATDVVAMDPLLDAFPIDIQVKKGVVTLTGSVDTDYEKWDASEEISAVNGVTGFKNELSLYKPRPKTGGKLDRDILTAIHYYLTNDPNLNFGDQVGVVVNHGEATLTGQVLTWPDSFESVEDAFQGGAIKVVNKIKINGQESAVVREYPSMPKEAYSHSWYYTPL